MSREEKLSKLQRWILVAAYKEILKNGSDFRKRDNRAWPNSKVQLLRIEVIRDYFKVPMQTKRTQYSSEGYLAIDTSQVTPEKANAVRSALTRTLRRLKERRLISGNIVLTERGTEVAKELYDP
jgi:hypothetical protein